MSKLFIHVADLEMKYVIGGKNGAGTPRLPIQSEPYVSFDRWPLLKRFHSYEMFYDMTRKRWPLNTDDC